VVLKNTIEEDKFAWEDEIVEELMQVLVGNTLESHGLEKMSMV